MKQTLVLAGLVFFFFLASPLFAEVQLEPDFEGTLLITFPDGKTTFIGTGEPVPAIPSQSLIEVLEGQATIKTGQGDAVKVSCLGHKGMAEDGSSVALACSTESGLLKVLQGSFRLVDREGKESNLSQGAEYLIRLGKPQPAPPTAGLETPGGPPLEGDLLAADPPVDSRNIESSPSR